MDSDDDDDDGVDLDNEEDLDAVFPTEQACLLCPTASLKTLREVKEHLDSEVSSALVLCACCCSLMYWAFGQRSEKRSCHLCVVFFLFEHFDSESGHIFCLVRGNICVCCFTNLSFSLSLSQYITVS